MLTNEQIFRDIARIYNTAGVFRFHNYEFMCKMRLPLRERLKRTTLAIRFMESRPLINDRVSLDIFGADWKHVNSLAYFTPESYHISVWKRVKWHSLFDVLIHEFAHAAMHDTANTAFNEFEAEIASVLVLNAYHLNYERSLYYLASQIFRLTDEEYLDFQHPKTAEKRLATALSAALNSTRMHKYVAHILKTLENSRTS